LVARQVAVIVAGGTSRPAIAATRTILIVFTTGFDPVATGLVSSLNKPDTSPAQHSIPGRLEANRWNPDRTGTRHGDHRTARQSRFDERCGTTTLAQQHALPTVYYLREFAEGGGLVSYGASITDAYRQAGVYSGRILKGAKPADLPVQLPTRFELVINLKTANALGLAVPPTLLATAEEVIE
jgi:ABC-type uncharacterized transport system substrate-binding protein